MNVERLIEQGNLDLALEKCMIILKEDLENPDYWYLLGKIFRINKKIEEAKETFYKSILLNPSSDAFFDIKAIGLPENRKFIRQIKSDKFYQYVLKKMQGVSKTEMSVLKKKKNNEKLPPPPPPPPPPDKKKLIKTEDIQVIDKKTIKKINTPPRKVKENELEIEKREKFPLQIQDLADEIEEEETLDSIEKKSAPIEEVTEENSVKDKEKQIDVDDSIEVSKAEVVNSEISEQIVPDLIDKVETIEPEEKPLHITQKEEKPLHITQKKEEEKEKEKEMTESMDLIIDALKTSETGKKTQDMSDIRHIEHLVEIEIVGFIQVLTGKDLIQAGDDKKRKLCDTIWNEHKKIDQKMTAFFIEFEKSVLLGLAKNGVEITAFGDRRKSGVIRVEINKLINKILKN